MTSQTNSIFFGGTGIRKCLKIQNREEIVPRFSFPGSAWECMTWRLCLHYRAELQLVAGQSPEDMDSQAEPGNQEKLASTASGVQEVIALIESPLRSSQNNK